MSLIVDASVAVKWVAEEPGSASARDLAESGSPLIAPDLVLLEVGSALRKKLARGIIAPTQASGGVGAVERAFAELASTRLLSAPAIKLALELNHPVYDCVYLALASREAIPFVTADERLFEAARRARIEARML